MIVTKTRQVAKPPSRLLTIINLLSRLLHLFRISTGGWSGNESIIRAMERNGMMWHLNWVQSRRGGHYIFEIYNVSYGLC